MCVNFSTDVTWTAAFTAWKPNQPSATSATRDTQDCVKTDKKGKWDEVACNSAKNYACQIAADTAPAGKQSVRN